MLAGACAGMAGMLVILFLQIPGRWVSGWMTLLSGVSVMLVVVGHAYTYGIPTSEWGSVLQVLFLLVSLQIPWMYRWLRPEFLRLPWKEFHAARTLGASAIRAYFDVLLPHVRPSVLRAMSLAAAFAVGEWAALSLLGLRGEVPLPVRIVRLRGQYEFQDATTLSSVLLLTAMWWIVLGEKITRRNQKI
jgi:putative spermidine/putrescine transport system permease protein